MSASFRVLCAAAAFSLGSLAAVSAQAGCTLNDEAGAVRRSLNSLSRCNDRQLRQGTGATCKLQSPPACAGTLVADSVALGYGANNPPSSGVDKSELADQLKCQKHVGRAIVGYVGRKLASLIKGQDAATAEERAARRLDRISDRCLVEVAVDVASSISLPSAGIQCAAALGDPGTPVDADALRTCVGTLLGVWVDRWGPNPQPLRPNMLFILTDDQRWDTTDDEHADGGPAIMARTRAELAEDGVEMTEAFLTTPLCCPSRASILSGQYAHRTGVYKNDGTNGGADDFDDSSTLAVWLQGAGYRTSLMGKYLNGYNNLWTTGSPPYVPPGWTEWRGMKRVQYFDYVIVEPDGLGGYVENSYGAAEADYSTDVLREKAKTFISDSVAAGEPFFLYLSFKAPHGPEIPAPRHDGLFAGLPPWRPPSYNEPDVSDKPAWVQATPQLDATEQAALDTTRIKQLEMLQAVDEAIGGSTTYGITGIMQHLRNLGIDDETIVVYLSDNGWQWGEHRMRAKNKPYEESLRTPMFVRYPKLAPLPRKDASMALNIDVAPTLAELAGAGVPIVEDGVSLVRVLDGTAGSWRSDFLNEGWPGNHPWASVRDAQWKYIEIPLVPGDELTGFELELYDLVADPYEENNVASVPANAARVAAMAARLRELRPNWPVDSLPNGDDPEE